MKLLYVGELGEHGTCLHRMRALQRLGFEVRGVDVQPYAWAGGRIAARLRISLLAGRAVARLNRDIVAAAAAMRPDFVWFDKPTFIRAATLRTLRGMGCRLVSYVIDNPFSPLPGEPGWRLVRRTIPLFDLNIVPRPVSVADFRAAGAGLIALMPIAFDPWWHFPRRPDAVPDGGAPVAVSFIGSPYGDRPAFLAALAARGLRVSVRGARWRRHRGIAWENLTLGPPAIGDDYRRAIWNARINLGLVTHGHRDPWAHRSFEIAGAGGFLLAERTEGHVMCFSEGHEAEFFASVEEAADKAAFYLANESARVAIARAGCRRAWLNGYSNDERLAVAIGQLDRALGVRLSDVASAVVARRRDALGFA